MMNNAVTQLITNQRRLLDNTIELRRVCLDIADEFDGDIADLALVTARWSVIDADATTDYCSALVSRLRRQERATNH